ncbi:MAG: 2-oxoglutarate and iron-dependent oxygenase domain-containing protein, partial [Alphaproteobacteria bacterium]|nr:2-oxoglutarate and iron-dependent oxygenase domain-containing protein [Alphaproteobacteria bacterium]
AQLESLPILDLGGYFAGDRSALPALAGQLRDALENIGFLMIVNHGVPQALIDRVYAEAARFHALPLADKLKLAMSRFNTGYVALGGGVSHASDLVDAPKPNQNAAFFVKRERLPNDPDVLAGKPHRGLNQWPDDLPGYRDTLLDYFATMEAMAQRLLPIYALALDLPADYFDGYFDPAQITLRLSHYPPMTAEDGLYGLAPHTDSGFMTLLPANDVPGLSIRPRGGDWQSAPRVPGAFIVNSGNMLRRWSNDRFLSTPHRVVNQSGGDRYAIPLFFDPNTERILECLPTCQSEDKPPLYEPITYGDYLTWFMNKNYRRDKVS